MDTLKALDIASFPRLYKEHMKTDFPLNERPPRRSMQKRMASGIHHGWVLSRDGREVAYAIDAIQNRDVLITHLAVFAGERGGGIGTSLLEHLRAQFEAYDCLIVEVENPQSAKDAAETQTRERRIAFYERSGFVLVPGLVYMLFGVDMLLMVLPIQAGAETVFARIIPTMQGLYRQMLPRFLMGQVRLEKT